MPITDFVEEQIRTGRWIEEEIPADVVGLERPLAVLRARRKSNLIVTKWHGDRDTFCPPVWSDLAIGSGPCGLGYRACFLMLTFGAEFVAAAAKWLANPQRRAVDTLGIGIDRSDSLLYEGVTHHVRNLAPLFGSAVTNPKGCKLILLTKTANVRYLEDIAPGDRRNIIVTFSLNPEPVADLWEGQWEDGTRLTPSIYKRIAATTYAHNLGFEVRARLDPILTPEGWIEMYGHFLNLAKIHGAGFTRFTLGTYRQKNEQLDQWRARWGLAPMGWEPRDLELDGTHWHLTVAGLIRTRFPEAQIALCKETHAVRRTLGLCNAACNCLA